MAAPWYYGAVTAKPQFYLAIGLSVIGVLRFIQRLFNTDGQRPAGIPTVIIPAAGLILLGVWQLMPSGDVSALAQIKSATFQDLLPDLLASPDLSGFAKGQHTVSPDATRLIIAQLTVALLAFWLSFDLFEDFAARRWLYWALALNGLAMAGFGIAQQLSWNGKLFWTVPLRFGGTPFGAFVNRNNGAGYLLLAFSCATACLVSAWFPFGVGQTAYYKDHSRSRFSEWFVRVLGHMTPAVMSSICVVAAIGVGILSSLSRAGAVGMAAAVLILLPAINRWKTRILVILVVFAGLSYAGLMWLGQNEIITARLNTMKNLGAALTGRVDHWRDVFPLIKDFSKTGSGLGTYAMANQLYVSQNTDFWFQHAENQYLEVASEGGATGLALFLVSLLLMAYASARAIRTDFDGRLLPSGLAGLLSVTSISTISLTDFSLSIGSIVLTFCVICGSVMAPFSRTRPVSLLILFATKRPIWRICVGTAVLLAVWPALLRLQFATEIERVVDQLPVNPIAPSLEASQYDELLSQLKSLEKQYPGEPRISSTAGQIYVARYRRTMFDDLTKQDLAKKMRPQVQWNSTHIERLDEAVSFLRMNGEFDKATQLLSSREVQDNLPQALAECRRSLQLNPLQPGLSMQYAWLTHILSDPAASQARNLAMFVGASDSDSLFQLGQLSAHRGDLDENISCWKRSLNISARCVKEIWDQSTLIRDESETLELVPDRLDVLLAVVQLPHHDLSVRDKIRSRIRKVVEADPHTSNAVLAEVYVELEDYPRAADSYLAAINENPFDIAMRLKASSVLERLGRIEEARATVGVALNIEPNRADIKKRFDELLSIENTAPTHPPN
ncbi:MAG: O-antigen ligase family protein [Planctomycetaceae bacterium]